MITLGLVAVALASRVRLRLGVKMFSNEARTLVNEKPDRPLRPGDCATAWIGWTFVLMFCLVSASGVELEEARKKFIGGDYGDCIRLCAQAILEKERDEEWPILLARSLLDTGKYPEAQTSIVAALKRSPHSIRIRLIGREVCLHNGQREQAAALLREINELGGGAGDGATATRPTWWRWAARRYCSEQTPAWCWKISLIRPRRRIRSLVRLIRPAASGPGQIRLCPGRQNF